MKHYNIDIDQKFDLDYIDGSMYAYLDVKGIIEVLHTCGYFDTIARNKINHYINMKCDELTERGAYVTECMKEGWRVQNDKRRTIGVIKAD